MNQKKLIILAVVVLLGVSYGIYQFTRDGGNKTNETNNNTPDMNEATDADKGKFSITGIAIAFTDGHTITTGKIKNNDNQARKVSVQVKFYNAKNRIAATANAIIDSINKGEEKTFSMSAMGDYSSKDYTYKVELEYIK